MTNGEAASAIDVRVWFDRSCLYRVAGLRGFLCGQRCLSTVFAAGCSKHSDRRCHVHGN